MRDAIGSRLRWPLASVSTQFFLECCQPLVMSLPCPSQVRRPPCCDAHRRRCPACPSLHHKRLPRASSLYLPSHWLSFSILFMASLLNGSLPLFYFSFCFISLSLPWFLAASCLIIIFPCFLSLILFPYSVNKCSPIPMCGIIKIKWLGDWVFCLTLAYQIESALHKECIYEDMAMLHSSDRPKSLPKNQF